MKALLCLDYENDVVHPEGKVSGKGYAAYNAAHNTLAIVRKVQDEFRAAGLPVIHVRVGFSPGYAQQPKGSPLMGKAHEFGAFDLSGFVVTCQAFVVGGHQIASFALGNGRHVALPDIGKHMAGALLIKPLQLGSAQRKQPAHYQFRHSYRMGLRVGQAQRTAP